jgi:maleate isomerase
MVEQEMIPSFPEGVRAHVTRLRMTGANRGTIDQLLPRVEEATRALADAKCDVIAFHCTANSMQEGKRGEERILTTMMRAGASRATTTATAVWRALRALNARRIVLVTPYDQETTDHEVEFLKEAGFTIIHAVGLALGGSDAYCAQPATFWKERATEAVQRDADAYFISCANISVLGIVEEIEARVGRPVITSNQVVIWDALSRLDWKSRRGLRGRLFVTSAKPELAPILQRG